MYCIFFKEENARVIPCILTIAERFLFSSFSCFFHHFFITIFRFCAGNTSTLSSAASGISVRLNIWPQVSHCAAEWILIWLETCWRSDTGAHTPTGHYSLIMNTHTHSFELLYFHTQLHWQTSLMDKVCPQTRLSGSSQDCSCYNTHTHTGWK